MLKNIESGKPIERKLCQRCKPEGYCITASSAGIGICDNNHWTGDPLNILQNGNRIARDQKIIGFIKAQNIDHIV